MQKNQVLKKLSPEQLEAQISMSQERLNRLVVLLVRTTRRERQSAKRNIDKLYNDLAEKISNEQFYQNKVENWLLGAKEREKKLYKTLQCGAGRLEFRLLLLHKGSAKDPIECSLEDYRNQKYKALSYTWGNPDTLATVSICGVKYTVRKNLHQALLHLCSKDEDQFIWVDALCINQGKTEERNQQVRLMADIYKTAEEVLVFLGAGSDRIDQAMKIMCKAEKLGGWKKASEYVENTKTTRSLKQGIQEILSLQWFERVWILQEVLHARSARIYYGFQSISPRILAAALAPEVTNVKAKTHCQAVIDIMPDAWNERSWGWSAWQERDKRGPRGIAALLKEFQYAKATDERDKIYALLSMSSDASSTDKLRPDYNKPLPSVIYDTVTFIIDYHEPGPVLEVFQHWNFDDLMTNISVLPKIAREWALDTRKLGIVTYFLHRHTISYDNSDTPDNFTKQVLRFAIDTENLELLNSLFRCYDAHFDSKHQHAFSRVAMNLAVESNKPDAIMAILDRFDTECHRNYLWSGLFERALTWAINMNDSDAIQHIINRFNSANRSEYNRKCLLTTAMKWAVEKKRCDVLKSVCAPSAQKLLLQDINYEDHRSMELLAARAGDLELLKIAFEAQSWSWDLDTSLQAAYERRDEEMIKLMLERGCINSGFLIDLLDWAMDDNRNDLLRLLLSRWIKLFPWYWGREEHLEGLLKRGADVNLQTANGNTALREAVEASRPELVRLSLTKRVDVNHQNLNGDTALLWAVEQVYYCRESANSALTTATRIVRLLLESGGDPNITSKPTVWEQRGRAPVHFAIKKGLFEVADMLLMNGASLKTASYPQGLSLCSAAIKRHYLLVELLLKYGGDIEERNDRTNRTPLLCAYKAGGFDICDVLLAHGADIHAKDNDNLTVLHYAYESWQIDHFRTLLERGADPNILDKGNHTLLFHAINARARDFERALLKAGARLDVEEAKSWKQQS